MQLGPFHKHTSPRTNRRMFFARSGDSKERRHEERRMNCLSTLTHIVSVHSAMPSTRQRGQNISLGADEINCLIYAYLQDSGFTHSAFNVRAEARLDASLFARVHIKRGLLVELLAKALLYNEVEAHWKDDPQSLSCKVPFTLLRKHVCSSSAAVALQHHLGSSMPTPPARGELFSRSESTTNGALDMSKRKASPRGREERSGKRARTADSMDMDEDDDNGRISRRTLSIDPDHPPTTGHYSEVTAQDGVSRRRGGKDPFSDRELEKEPHLSKRMPVSLLNGHTAEVFVCAWNSTFPRMLATGSNDATVRLWELPSAVSGLTEPLPETFGTSLVLTDKPSSVNTSADDPQTMRDIICMDWSPDGMLLATGSYDVYLRVWKRDGTPYFLLQSHEGPIFSILFSASGRYVLTASLDGTACVWDIREKRLFREYRYHQGCCLDIEWIDDTTFASSSADKEIHILSLESNAPIRILRGHEDEVNQIKLSPDRAWLASCSDDCNAIVWSIAGLKLDSGVTDGAAIPGLANGTGVLDDPSIRKVMIGHQDSISQLTWAPIAAGRSSQMFATCSFDCTTRIWDAEIGTCLQVIDGHVDKCYTASFSPDTRFIATGSGDGTVFISLVHPPNSASGSPWTCDLCLMTNPTTATTVCLMCDQPKPSAATNAGTNSKTSGKCWSWQYPAKGVVYDIAWQKTGEKSLIAVCLSSKVAVVDTALLPALA